MKKKLMKGLLFLLLIGMFVGTRCIDSEAAAGAGITWSVKNGTLTIGGTGAVMTDYTTDTSAPWYAKRSSIKKIVVGDNIKVIGRYAFAGLTNVTDVEFPEYLTEINAGAFKGCTSLTSVTLPDEVTYIKENAFKNCTALSSVYLGDGMTALLATNGSSFTATSPFYGCSALETLSVPADSASLLGNVKLCGSANGTPGILTKLEYRGTKEQLKNDMANVTNSAILFAKTIECTDGTWDNTEPLIENDRYTIYENRVVEFSGKKVSLTSSYSSLCPYITKLKLSYTVTSFADNQLSKCTSLTKIIFAGTSAEWKAISRGSGNALPSGCKLTVHIHDLSEEVLYEPTCYKDGYTVKKCVTCEREVGDHYDITAATRHMTDKTLLSSTAATCQSKGSEMYRCNVCGAEFEIELPVDPDAHNLATKYVTANCQHPGGTSTYCTYCLTEISFDKDAEQLDHAYVYDGTYDDSSTRCYCKYCGLVKEEAPSSFYGLSFSETGQTMIYENNSKLAIEVSYSLDGGETWTVWGAASSENPTLTKSYSAGESYTFRMRYLHTYHGKAEYSPYSDSHTFTIPSEIPEITSVTNGLTSGSKPMQKITWSHSSDVDDTLDNTYYFEFQLADGSWYCYNDKLDATSVSSDDLKEVSLTNGQKMSYIVGCLVCDYFNGDQGNMYYINTGKVVDYYYLSRPAFTYYKNLATRKIKLTWKRNSAATGYQVKYVCGSTKKTYTITSNKTVTKTLTGLTKGKTYKCYVRSYKTVNGQKSYSAWSSYKSIKIVR